MDSTTIYWKQPFKKASLSKPKRWLWWRWKRWLCWSKENICLWRHCGSILPPPSNKLDDFCVFLDLSIKSINVKMRELWKVTSVMCVIFYHGSTRNFGRETSKLNKDAKCLQTHSSPKACQTLLLLLLLLPLLLFILIIRLKSSCFCTSKLFSFSFQWSPPLFRSDGHSGSANAPGRSPLLPLHARPLPDRHKWQWLHQAGRDSLPQEKPTNLSLTKISVTETKFSSRGRRQLLRCSHTKTIPAQRQWGGSHIDFSSFLTVIHPFIQLIQNANRPGSRNGSSPPISSWPACSQVFCWWLGWGAAFNCTYKVSNIFEAR